MNTGRLKTANIHFNKSGACSMAFSTRGIHYEKSIAENERTERTMDKKNNMTLELLTETKASIMNLLRFEQNYNGTRLLKVYKNVITLINAEIDRQTVVEEGRFPNEAEHEYNQNFEKNCKRTGINVIEESKTSEEVQKAIDWFEKEINDITDFRKHFVESGMFDSYNIATDYIKINTTALRALRQMELWINVSERPKQAGMYFVYNDMDKVKELGIQDYHTKVELMYHSKKYDKWATNSIVTHWMPLPKPPKENK